MSKNIVSPLLSIITVSFNSAKTIEETINSVLSQKNELIEYIIIDGGSTDQTMSIVEKHKNNIDVVISEADQGIFDAMNKGVAVANGKFISFINSDDYYKKNCLGKIIAILQQKEFDLLYGDLVYINAQREVQRHWVSGQFLIKKLRLLWVPPHPSSFINRELFINLNGFNTKYHLAADYDLFLRALNNIGLKVYYLSEIIVNMRIGGASNASLSNIFKQNIQIANAYKQVFGHYPLLAFVHKLFNRLYQKFKAKTLTGQ
jgi:glycosyltransferase